MTREPPKRGARCDHCNAPATVLFYQWHGCSKCATDLEEITARWDAQRQQGIVVQ